MVADMKTNTVQRKAQPAPEDVAQQLQAPSNTIDTARAENEETRMIATLKPHHH